MDQESRPLAWWTEAVFHDWRSRSGPRYARLAAAILAAIDRKSLRQGTKVPAERALLPTTIQNVNFPSFPSHGLDPVGLPHLREAVARHLTRHQGLPSDPAQIVITNGAQEALWLLTRILPPAPS